VIGREPLQIGNSTTSALKLMLNFQGSNQFAWLDESGDILQEKGMLGLRLEKTSREQALATLGITKGEDLTRLASVPSGAPIERPSERKVLRVRIRGVDPAGLALNGGRQQLENDILTVRRESLEGLARELEPQSLGTLEQIFLKPTPFIQSDHEKIRQLALSLAQSGKASVLERAAALVQWVHRNVEKRPTISVPDALAVLSNRVGDCNEHAVLLAALARAAGIPARIETGLVYQDGRFYYHAWNLLYLGRWITADAVLGQLPADVTHIRITSGSHEENRLLGVIGKVQIDLLGEDATARQNDESQIR
jgi:transglutaminase-like putative cysteine protease